MSQGLVLKIKGLLEENNLSIQGLEKKAGLKINAVRNILTGHSKKPSAETLMAVAKALDCSIGDLLEESLTNQRRSYSFKDEIFSNHSLLTDATTYVIKTYAENEEDVRAKDLISISQEIYKYSSENNNGVFDEKFAKWLLAKHFG